MIGSIILYVCLTILMLIILALLIFIIVIFFKEREYPLLFFTLGMTIFGILLIVGYYLHSIGV